MSDQIELGLAERHAGQNANLAAGSTVHRSDRNRVEVAVARYAKQGAMFTADDIHQAVAQDGGPLEYDRNLVSSVLGVWSKDGRIIRQPAYAVSVRKSRHASRNAIWRGQPHTAVPEPREGEQE